MNTTEKLKCLGLSEQKVKETEKNANLTSILVRIIDQVSAAFLPI